MVRLVPSSIGNAAFKEYCLKLALRLGMLSGFQNSCMSNGGDIICLPYQRNLIVIFQHPTVFNSPFQDAKVPLFEWQKGNFVRNLACDGKDVTLGSRLRESFIDLRGRLDLINIIEARGFLFGEGQSRPYHRIRVDWGDEKGQLVRRCVVDEMTIRNSAAAEVVKVTALSIASQTGQQAGSDSRTNPVLPERSFFIVILDHSSLLSLQVQHTRDISSGGLDVVDYTTSVGFGGVFASQNGISVLCHRGEMV